MNVEEINGKKLKQKINIGMPFYKKLKSQNGKKITLIGYESLKIGGIPKNYFKYSGNVIATQQFYIINTLILIKVKEE
ncbi:hypothetical protein AAEX28_06685 [Lentisphaerota bacterium WC36G]|nr:hypothetical protein LJT99_09550 [Lentisphaerae bacterium WC36]